MPNQFTLVATREALQDVIVKITVTEQWSPAGASSAPSGWGPPMPPVDGHFVLLYAAWHAQVGLPTGRSATCAERLDLDPSKQEPLWCHRYPYGQPNDVRVRQATMGGVENWIDGVESIVIDRLLSGGQMDEADHVD